ncbi:MAG: type II toxin-antitoxin system RelE/ParE family toxin [Clostridiales bacterium]|jgi:phage-related protein|nr:type II toxin-antitoxin system RelE/ParE family toxin [Clostridiales bacterium]
MYEVIFYQDAAGNQPVKEHLIELSRQTDKNSRLNHNKISDYITLLKKHGLALRKPVIDSLGDGLWELRPLKNRVLFFMNAGNEFILLHHFIKKTRKTPKSEKETARRRMKDFIERSKKHE